MTTLQRNISSCLNDIKQLTADSEKIAGILHNILIIRSTEEALVSSKRSCLRGPIHSYVGQEAVASGVLANVSLDDAVTSTIVVMATIWQSGNIFSLLDELCGLETGCNGGKEVLCMLLIFLWVCTVRMELWRRSTDRVWPSL